MRHMKTVHVPACDKQEVDHTTCDLCNQPIKNKLFVMDDVVLIARTTGDSYPEGGECNTTAFDLCGDCFMSRLLPWMQSQGATPRVEDWDY